MACREHEAEEVVVDRLPVLDALLVEFVGVGDSLLCEVLGEADVADHLGERRDDTSALDPPDGVDRSPDVGHHRPTRARPPGPVSLGSELLAPPGLLLDVLVVGEVREVARLGDSPHLELGAGAERAAGRTHPSR